MKLGEVKIDKQGFPGVWATVVPDDENGLFVITYQRGLDIADRLIAARLLGLHSPSGYEGAPSVYKERIAKATLGILALEDLVSPSDELENGFCHNSGVYVFGQAPDGSAELLPPEPFVEYSPAQILTSAAN